QLLPRQSIFGSASNRLSTSPTHVKYNLPTSRDAMKLVPTTHDALAHNNRGFGKSDFASRVCFPSRWLLPSGSLWPRERSQSSTHNRASGVANPFLRRT